MVNRYFVQYLLNVGVLNSETVVELLPQAANVKPELPVLAMRRGLMTATQLADLNTADQQVFSEEAKDKKLLTAAQIDTLLNEAPERDVCFAQVLLNKGIVDYSRLETLFADCDKQEQKESPVCTAVKNRIGHLSDEPAFEFYGSYADMFILSLQRFMNTDAVVLPEKPELKPEGTYIVSQSLSGGAMLTPGLLADQKVFLELAKRYSCEDLTEIDELAIDSVTEFINVLNGLYIVNLSQQELDVDLEEPREAQNVLPEAGNLESFEIATEFGCFCLYLATDEFMFI